jgi:starch phosphorylase
MSGSTIRVLRWSLRHQWTEGGMNGIPNLSILDGWWYEGYNARNGWAISDPPEDLEVHYDDTTDAASLYELLEQQIVPMYYERNHEGLPNRWIQTVRESIKSVIPRYSANRMLKEYVQKMYVPAWMDADRDALEAKS